MKRGSSAATAERRQRQAGRRRGPACGRPPPAPQPCLWRVTPRNWELDPLGPRRCALGSKRFTASTARSRPSAAASSSPRPPATPATPGAAAPGAAAAGAAAAGGAPPGGTATTSWGAMARSKRAVRHAAKTPTAPAGAAAWRGGGVGGGGEELAGATSPGVARGSPAAAPPARAPRRRHRPADAAAERPAAARRALAARRRPRPARHHRPRPRQGRALPGRRRAAPPVRPQPARRRPRGRPRARGAALAACRPAPAAGSAAWGPGRAAMGAGPRSGRGPRRARSTPGGGALRVQGEASAVPRPLGARLSSWRPLGAGPGVAGAGDPRRVRAAQTVAKGVGARERPVERSQLRPRCRLRACTRRARAAPPAARARAAAAAPRGRAPALGQLPAPPRRPTCPCAWQSAFAYRRRVAGRPQSAGRHTGGAGRKGQRSGGCRRPAPGSWSQGSGEAFMERPQRSGARGVGWGSDVCTCGGAVEAGPRLGVWKAWGLFGAAGRSGWLLLAILRVRLR
jgi:hypothetical protein